LTGLHPLIPPVAAFLTVSAQAPPQRGIVSPAASLTSSATWRRRQSKTQADHLLFRSTQFSTYAPQQCRCGHRRALVLTPSSRRWRVAASAPRRSSPSSAHADPFPIGPRDVSDLRPYASATNRGEVRVTQAVPYETARSAARHSAAHHRGVPQVDFADRGPCLRAISACVRSRTLHHFAGLWGRGPRRPTSLGTA